MRSKFIKLDAINDIKNFIFEASNVNGDIEVRKGRWSVDGKSIMGLMSIDTSAGVTVIYPDDADDFDEFLNNFQA